MRVISNSLIPFKGFIAINVFGIIFVRRNVTLSATTLNHEYIHTLQQREMLFLFFYIIYIIEWLIRLIIYRDRLKAYRNISFEREAYNHEADFKYVKSRHLYAWTRCILKNIMHESRK